jgi:hypothetical protein
MTFSRACRHIENYSAAHESRWRLTGDARFEHPPNHIEIDNRLSWLLGRLDLRYGDKAFYVHLTRNREATAQSFERRWDHSYSIIRAYGHNILGFRNPEYAICQDYCDTVNANIEQFLANKSKWMRFRLENATDDFRIFWDRIGATGDLSNALAEWTTKHNQGSSARAEPWRQAAHKAVRILRGLPRFVRDA